MDTDRYQRTKGWADKFRVESKCASLEIPDDDPLKQLIIASTQSMADELEQELKQMEKEHES